MKLPVSPHHSVPRERLRDRVFWSGVCPSSLVAHSVADWGKWSRALVARPAPASRIPHAASSRQACACPCAGQGDSLDKSGGERPPAAHLAQRSRSLSPWRGQREGRSRTARASAEDHGDPGKTRPRGPLTATAQAPRRARSACEGAPVGSRMRSGPNRADW